MGSALSPSEPAAGGQPCDERANRGAGRAAHDTVAGGIENAAVDYVPATVTRSVKLLVAGNFGVG
jgi:hypothetical protein